MQRIRGSQGWVWGASFARRALLLLQLACVASGCAATRDVYAGSDVRPQDAGAIDARADLESDSSLNPMADGASDDSGSRRPPACTGTAADCDGDPNNGCEVDLANDATHCGLCAIACQSPDCACRDGRLVTRCLPGRADCDANPANGCEVDLDTSMQHCGSCGRRCHTGGHDAVAAVCGGGKCVITCQIEAFPEGDCDGNPDNGCETQLWSNDNCGACGIRCTCSNGVCL